MIADHAYGLLRHALFRLEAERAHELTLGMLGRAPHALGRLARRAHGAPSPSLARDAFGLRLLRWPPVRHGRGRHRDLR